MIHGRNLIVALDGVAVAGAKSCSLQLSQNFIEACAPNSGRVHEKIPTTYEWSVSVDCLVPNSNLPVSLKDKLIAGTKCLLTFTDGDGDNRAGFVYVKSCDEGGTVGSLATFKASFEPSGALYKYTQVNLAFDQGTYGCKLVATGGSHLEYDFQASSQEGVALADLRIPKKGYLYVPTSEVWAIFHSETASTISQAFYYADEDVLDRYFYKYNEFGVNMLPIDPYDMHTYNYVVACNEKTTAIFLYE